MSPAAAEWQSERRAPSSPGGGAEPRKIHVIQGEFHVSDDADVVLTTILGSCVAACVRDPVAGVGGMNHFLLPGETGGEAHVRTPKTASIFSFRIATVKGFTR